MSKIESYKNPSLLDFLQELYKPVLNEKGIIKNKEYIKIEKYNNKYLKKEEFFNNINELCLSVESPSKFYYDTYFSLATNNGNSKAINDSLTRTCIAFDFDKKDNEGLEALDLMHIFSKKGLFYHCIIDSGHGFHVYIFINRTNNLKLVNEVTKHIAILLGADLNCTTQILRVPFTLNCKEDNNKKRVNIIKLYKDIRRKNIEELAKRYIMKCNENKNIEYLLNERIPDCLKLILENGSDYGNRNKDLQKIVILLRNMRKSEASILAISEEWNNKNEVYFENLEYQVNKMYNELVTTELNCANCKYNKDCYSKVMSNFEYEEGEQLIQYSENMCKKCKRNKKGVAKMNGNQLLVVGILKTHFDGLTQDQLLDKLQYTNEKYKIENVAMSKPTLVKVLKELEENKYITYEIVNRKRVYTLIKERVKEECKFIINYGVVRECVKGFINPSELELYCYMRYLHNEQQRLGLAKHKGNLFQITQEELALKMGIHRERITVMINNLIKEDILSIWYRGKLENSPCWYNVYRLNY